MFWTNRDGRSRPGGRRAGCPHPAAVCAAANTPGRYGIRPYGRRHGARPNGKPQPCGIANPCRGRCLHRPGDLAAARGSPGGINPAPVTNARPNGMTAAPRYCNLCRGRCLHRPGDFAAAQGSTGGMPSSRRGLRRRERPRADMESTPTTPWRTAGQTVWPQPCRQTQGGMPLFFKKTKAPRCPRWAAGRCFVFVLYFSQGFSQALSRAARCAARR